MSKVFCPECQNIVSSYAETCPDCGFPISKYIKDAKLNDFSKTFVCPKCGSFSTATDVVATIQCDFCGTPMFQTSESTTITISNTSWPKTEDEIDSYIYSLLEKCDKVEEYDIEAHRIYKQKLRERVMARRKQQSNQQSATPPSTNQPHCPICQSTNIEKIGMFKRMLSTSMFGIASDKVGKQWHCKNCGNNF